MMRELVLAKKTEQKEYQKLVHEYLDEFKEVDPSLEIIKGEYDYPHFKDYFEKDNYYPFYLMIDKKIAGLAMVYLVRPNLYALTEFYLKKEYRHHENAAGFAFAIFNRFHGNFTLSTPINNVHGISFWDKFVSHFNYHKIKHHHKITWVVIQQQANKL